MHDVLAAADARDLVLLLGAQGMDRGQELARAWLREHEAVGGAAVGNGG